MTVLFVAPPSSFTDQVRCSLERAVERVTVMPERQVPLWRLLRRAGPLRKWSNRWFNARLRTIALGEQPHVLFAVKGTTIANDTLALLHKRGIVTVNWFPENVHHQNYREWFAKHHAVYHYFCTFDSSVGLPYVPFAVDPSLFAGTGEDERYRCDVLFVGAPYPERIAALERIYRMGVRVKIFGWRGWNRTPLAPIYHGPLSIQESAEAYRSATICLNMNLEPAIAGVNLKTFEIAAAGGFQLSDYRSDIEGLFAMGKEIAVFRSNDELDEQIRYYLTHENERAAIARAARARVLRDHTMDQRIHEILSLLRNV